MMKKFNKILCFILTLVLTLTISNIESVEAATIGVPLKSPEIGWQRYDEGNSLIKLSNFDYKLIKSSGCYNNTISWTNDVNGKIEFTFYGTKLRVIGAANKTEWRTIDKITIDDKSYTYSEVSKSEDNISQALMFEVTGLKQDIHHVTIQKASSIATKSLTLDAIDIDDDGALLNNSNPIFLKAVFDKSKVDLTWTSVTGASSYSVKRSTTSGGNYKEIATGSAITYSDSNVKPDTAYYYIVTALVNGKETPDSNEVIVTIPKEETKTLKVVLEPKEEIQLSVDSDLSENTNMTWNSSDSTVATVDTNGKVRALVPGNTMVTVTSTDGTYTEYINILVVDDADELRLAVDLREGERCRVTIDDLANTTKVTWDTMDSIIAKVTAKGKITAASEGLTLITATDSEGSVIGQVYVRVRK